MFEELTVKPSSLLYLISRLCWRKPKWKWHHFHRICNSSELKTIWPTKHVILCLRGWARHPQAQTGLRFVAAWACVCLWVSEWASGGVLQEKSLSCVQMRKANRHFFPFPIQREEPLFSVSGDKGTYLPLCELVSVLLYTYTQLHLCVCVSCSALLFHYFYHMRGIRSWLLLKYNRPLHYQKPSRWFSLCTIQS